MVCLIREFDLILNQIYYTQKRTLSIRKNKKDKKDKEDKEAAKNKKKAKQEQRKKDKEALDLK